MRLNWIIFGGAMVIIGLLVLLVVPDTAEHITVIDLRGARSTTVTEQTVTERFVHGTQWPDYLGNSMLLIGLVVTAMGLGMHGKRPRTLHP